MHCKKYILKKVFLWEELLDLTIIAAMTIANEVETVER
jgi:hypothetical protein